MVECLDPFSHRLLQLLDVADSSREMRVIDPGEDLKDVDATVRAVAAGSVRSERGHQLDPELRWRKGDETLELRPDGPLHFNSTDALLMAAEAGAGITCVLDIFVNRRIAEGTLVQLYPEWTTAVKTFYVVMPKSRVGSAKVKAFVDFLFEVFDAHRRPSGRRAVGIKAIGKR